MLKLEFETASKVTFSECRGFRRFLFVVLFQLQQYYGALADKHWLQNAE